jgi:hypothetical protein
MINSKPHPLREILPDIYIFAILSAFSFSSAKPALSCSFKSSKFRRKNICFFFAVAQRYQNRSLCVWPLLSHWRRSAEEHRVYLSIKRHLELVPLLVSPHRILATAI